ncbi:MAG: DUF1003 domain-containing protein [Deltaproteobacteria bacterium]|nr:DUF1003 domain-containing protein [Deltaproteobacteria bacterium]
MQNTTPSQQPVCQICGRHAPETSLVAASLIRPAVTEVITHTKPDWSEDGYICVDDLNHFRYEYVSSLVADEKGELTDLEKEVLESMEKHEILSTQVDEVYESQISFGQRLSDRIAQFGGSWSFIIFFAVVMAVWITINSLAILAKPYDPFPYILLNLVLSCLAAIQAPIIMMSQNRQEDKDRARASHDYQVNLKAELEIRQLHQKLDHLLSHQWERLVEIQKIQLELLSEMRGAGETTASPRKKPGAELQDK